MNLKTLVAVSAFVVVAFYANRAIKRYVYFRIMATKKHLEARARGEA